MKIEIDLPEFFQYEYTGEYRIPEHDEWGCRGPGGDQVRNCNPNIPLFILRREIPKPEPTLLERIEAAYLEYEVRELWFTDNAGPDANFLQVRTGIEEYEPHVMAQSMRGFAGYVYQIEEGEFLKWKDPSHLVYGDVIMPVAVLFEK